MIESLINNRLFGEYSRKMAARVSSEFWELCKEPYLVHSPTLTQIHFARLNSGEAIAIPMAQFLMEPPIWMLEAQNFTLGWVIRSDYEVGSPEIQLRKGVSIRDETYPLTESQVTSILLSGQVARRLLVDIPNPIQEEGNLCSLGCNPEDDFGVARLPEAILNALALSYAKNPQTLEYMS